MLLAMWGLSKTHVSKVAETGATDGKGESEVSQILDSDPAPLEMIMNSKSISIPMNFQYI